jgi:hypothetical protein
MRMSRQFQFSLSVFLAATFLVASPLAHGVILYRTGDPTANTTEPAGPLAGSGWQYEGTFGAFLGTAIAPHFFITARHVGVQSSVLMYQGSNYNIVGYFDDPNSDLRIYQVAETFPTFAPLYSSSDETGKPLVVIGRGTQRGSEIYANGLLRGWTWGATDMVQRWGQGRVSYVYGFAPSDFLCSLFDQNDLPDEAGLSSGDSGGAVFVQENGVWKLAGINFSVDGPVATSPTDEQGFYGVFFDRRGLYNPPNMLFAGSEPLPSGFYATRISTKLNWIYSIAAPGLANISARAVVGAGDQVAIAGFIIDGSAGQTKRMVVRAMGPSLETGGVPLAGRLMDPTLELYDSTGAMIGANDNWRSSQASEIQNSGFAPGSDNESVIIATLPVGSYTVVMRGVTNATGIGLIEVYDLDSGADSHLVNLSARGFVGIGDDVLIGGLIVRANSRPLLLRALGPELTAKGVSGALSDPMIEMLDSNGEVVASNDNWQDAPNKTDILATGLAPTDDRESAILTNPAPGSYTAIVRGAAGGTGIALAEAYLLSQ